MNQFQSKPYIRQPWQRAANFAKDSDNGGPGPSDAPGIQSKGKDYESLMRVVSMHGGGPGDVTAKDGVGTVEEHPDGTATVEAKKLFHDDMAKHHDACAGMPECDERSRAIHKAQANMHRSWQESVGKGATFSAGGGSADCGAAGGTKTSAATNSTQAVIDPDKDKEKAARKEQLLSMTGLGRVLLNERAAGKK